MQWLSLCVDCPNCVKTRPQLNTEVDNKFFEREASFLTHCTTLHMERIIQFLILDILEPGIVFLVIQKQFGHSFLHTHTCQLQ